VGTAVDVDGVSRVDWQHVRGAIAHDGCCKAASHWLTGFSDGCASGFDDAVLVVVEHEIDDIASGSLDIGGDKLVRRDVRVRCW
jgi:hypothetical protein